MRFYECLIILRIFVHTNSCTIMDNQQLSDLTVEQEQVLLTGIFGDGCLRKNSKNSVYTTNCIHKEYLEFKKNLLGDLNTGEIHYQAINGYSGTPIYRISSKTDERVTRVHNYSIETALSRLTDLGVAMWIYDDGSMHKDKLFHNINTHKYSEEVNRELLIPFFNTYNIYPKVTKEVKKDGRIFYYLRVSKYEGSYEISKILEKYPVDCFKYKSFSSETILSWSKLQVELKSRGIDCNYIRFGKLLNELLKTGNMQDIVQSLERSKAGITYTAQELSSLVE